MTILTLSVRAPLLFFAFIFVLLALLGCGAAGSSSATQNTTPNNPETWQIRHYQVECTGVGVFTCLQVKQVGSEGWTYFYDAIVGFDYQWGYNYTIAVRVDDIPPAQLMADGASTTTTLLELVERSQELATTVFDFAVGQYGAGALEKTSDDTYRILGGKLLQCAALDCASIDSLLVQEMAMLLELKHNEDPSLPLRLSQIKCSAARSTFRESCL